MFLYLLNNKSRLFKRAFLTAMVVFMASPAAAMLNPAAVYCSALGYEYFTGETKKGTIGACKLPDGQVVNASRFYRGLVALEWSYCAQQGYEAKRIENSDICKECTACVLPDGTEVPVSRLMNLKFVDAVCGNGNCGMRENHAICPQDCPSGWQDDYCDGVQDNICDSDCVELGGTDPDCPQLFVDIKPGSCPNAFNPEKKGVLSAAILGTANFKVTNIDPQKITLIADGSEKGINPLRWSFKDVATPNPSGNCECWQKLGDRVRDLVLIFDAQKVSKTFDLRKFGGETIPLTIIVNMKNDSTQKSGQDCLRVLKK